MSVAEPAPSRTIGDWQTPLAVGSIALFVFSAGIGTVVAYDPAGAVLRLANLLVGLLACGMVVLAGMMHRWWVWAGLGYVAASVSLVVGVWGRRAATDDVATVAGVLVILLPLQAAGVLLAHLRGHRVLAEVMGCVAMLSAWLLILTGERSTWLAAILGMVTALLWGRRPGSWSPQLWRRLGVGWMVVCLLMAAGYVTFLVMPGSVMRVVLPSDGDIVERATVWRQMLGLAGDYRFTGSGLGMTAMVASSYLFLLHVPLFHHAHNVVIQIMLEQGVLSVVGLAGLAVATGGMAWRVAKLRDPALHVLGGCAFAAIVIAMVHGLLDSELYAGGWAPIFFLPFGYGWGVYIYARRTDPGEMVVATQDFWSPSRMVGLVVLFVIVGIGLWTGLGGRAAWYANLGAIAQTRAELSVYHWPEWGVQDQVRRLPEVNLEPARAWLQRALTEDPQNPTALRRLGQIALARGEYALAQPYLLAASEAHPQDRAVRQLLGECYALDGALADAVRQWQAIDLSHNQLGLRLAWYETLGDSHHTQHMQEAIKVYERGNAPP